ncbi:ADP-ribose pyrophosphatase [Enterococcus sp. PF1-24]|uniref:NUDIX domain-containing protein n=1 Tax=unclassified Enterococcus TaxID=2608891 RepID=UPI0024736CC3|nr:MULTISPECIES: NUDIX hydrolase [unclassified Enterococcus]MDH6365075.1 ADP-ribose pyrophosphatase [Enterococcus sp. PFB1-1]MDH6402152.1 ADP-ribose pyrophosphatase [Enterococcus sp. PF1-24]
MELNLVDFEKNQAKFIEKTVKRQEIFKGQIIDVALDTVQLPNGQEASRELVFHPGGVGIIPVLTDGRILFVKQFRKPLEKIILEIPAGKIEPTENRSPEVTAKRELEEETGYQASNWQHLIDMYVSPGFADECLHIYYADGLQKVENPLPQDEDEVIELYALTLAEAKEAVAKGWICDAKTLYAVQYCELQQLQGK